MNPTTPDGHPGKWWHPLEDGVRIQCDLCPRACKLRDGQRAFCFVRKNVGGQMQLTSYGRSTGFCIDPIEKKPLNHFYPGSSVLSFGTAGCNLGCRFCQNWTISKAKHTERLSDAATPREIALQAKADGCTSVAFTYNDPVIFAEYAIDTAIACHEEGVKTVAVTAGYITEQAREAFFGVLDATNIDLKAFTQQFYHKLCFANLAPILDTLRYVRHETNVWLEITTLLIPGHNDSEAEVAQLCEWIAENLGGEVPLHFSAFHPDFKMREVGRTPASTLSRARKQAKDAGLQHVYTGNVSDEDGQSTYCGSCGELIIQRDWYRLGRYRIRDGHCTGCGHPVPGRFTDEKGNWGQRRQSVRIR